MSVMKVSAKRQLDATDTVLLIIEWLIRVALLVSAAIALVTVQWMLFFVSIAVLLLTFGALFTERRYNIEIPLEIEVFITVFIYAALYLGTLVGFYDRFWWWDSLLHFSSALIFGLIGFAILYVLYRQNKLDTNPFIIAMFAFSFALAIGALWEVFEFGMDQAFGLNMQPSAVDTMQDLIIDGIGALITATAGYFYIKRRKTSILHRLIQKFFQENPRFADKVAPKTGE